MSDAPSSTPTPTYTPEQTVTPEPEPEPTPSQTAPTEPEPEPQPSEPENPGPGGIPGVIENAAEGLYFTGKAIYDGVTDPAPGESQDSPIKDLGEAQDHFAEMSGDALEGAAEGGEGE